MKSTRRLSPQYCSKHGLLRNGKPKPVKIYKRRNQRRTVKAATLLLASTMLVEKLKQIPPGYRQRCAAIIWFDDYAGYPAEHLHPALKAMVREKLFIDDFPWEKIAYFLQELGYDKTRAQNRMKPIYGPPEYVHYV